MDWQHIGEIVLAFVVGAIVVGTIFLVIATVWILPRKK